MALRLVEVVVPDDKKDDVYAVLTEHQGLGVWHHALSEQRMVVKVLVPAEQSEAVLDALQKRCAQLDGFRVMVTAVEATIPRVPPPAPPDDAPEPGEPAPKVPRISREELYAGIADSTRISPVFMVMVVLSSIVAAIGVMRDNVAVIIGAMVIAPLLGPNVAQALAATLGDIALARRAARANVLGVSLAFAVSALLGLLLPVDPTLREVVIRTEVGLSDVVLALAAGCAGVLAFTTGVSTTVVGVMVAVALLPPLVACGLLTGAGQWPLAGGALLLAATNVICLNLAGVVTFLAQGVRPRTWWEADRAKKAVQVALTLWTLLLAALVAVIVVWQYFFDRAPVR